MAEKRLSTPGKTARRPPKPEHVLDEAGVCKRCGGGSRWGSGHCPPGYWMTAAERRRWLALDRLPAEERHKAQDNLERQILEKRSHG